MEQAANKTKIHRERVKYRGAFDAPVIRSCSLKPRQIYVPTGVKQTTFSQFFSCMELAIGLEEFKIVMIFDVHEMSMMCHELVSLKAGIMSA